MEVKESLIEWSNSLDPKLLDLRGEITNKLCLMNSSWIPYHDLDNRWCELPTKQESLTILVSYNNEIELAKANFIKDRGWKVPYIFIGTEEFWCEAKELQLIVDFKLPYTPIKLLFSPCPFLKHQFQFIQTKLLESNQIELNNQPNNSDSDTNYLTCIDVGCGSGRDLAWIGLNSPSWRLSGLDYVKGALHRTQLLLTNIGVSHQLGQLHQVKFLPTGLLKSTGPTHHPDLPSLLHPHPSAFHLVLCIRLLERASFPHLRSLILPGGYLLYSTFVHLPDLHPYDHPTLESGRRLLPSELAEAFGPSQGFTIIHDEIQLIEDGRPVNSFLARKNF